MFKTINFYEIFQSIKNMDVTKCDKGPCYEETVYKTVAGHYQCLRAKSNSPYDVMIESSECGSMLNVPSGGKHKHVQIDNIAACIEVKTVITGDFKCNDTAPCSSISDIPIFYIFIRRSAKTRLMKSCYLIAGSFFTPHTHEYIQGVKEKGRQRYQRETDKLKGMIRSYPRPDFTIRSKDIHEYLDKKEKYAMIIPHKYTGKTVSKIKSNKHYLYY